MLKRSLLVEGSCSRSAFISALPGTTGRLLSLQAAAGSTFYLLLYTFTPLRCLCSNDICTIRGKFGSHLLLDIKETSYRTTLQAACPWSHSQYMPPSYITLKKQAELAGKADVPAVTLLSKHAFTSAREARWGTFLCWRQKVSCFHYLLLPWIKTHPWWGFLPLT